MIAATYTGWNPAGLVVYLLGPGRHEEHVNPRVVAGSLPAAAFNPISVTLGPTWPVVEAPPDGEAGDDDTGRLDVAGTGWRDGRSLAWLCQYLETGVLAAGLPLRSPTPDSRWYGREGYVWHTAVRLHAEDPVLDDATWGSIAQRLIDAAGLGPAGCRWVAVRHGADHIHLAAVLVRRQGGVWKRFHPKWWKLRMRQECVRIEAEYGLRPTPAVARTTAAAPTKAELRKADRLGHEAPRVWLRRELMRIAATVRGPTAFDAALRGRGIRVRYRRDQHDRVIGYAVAAPHSGTEPVYFSGTKLAPDLTWPQLLHRWETFPADDTAETEILTRAPDAAAALDEITSTVAHATDVVRRNPPQNAQLPAIAYATGELLQTAAAVVQPIDPFDTTTPYRAAAAVFAPLARQGWPTGEANPLADVARQLRRAARHLAVIDAPPTASAEADSTTAGAQFALAVAALVAEVGAWHYDRQQHAHVQTATATVACLRNYAALRRQSPADPVSAPVPQRHSQPTRAVSEQQNRTRPVPPPRPRPTTQGGPPAAGPRRRR